ncbi:phage major capsid protein [Canibacter sp. lx-72]|nr:phage major capsid protein [Canibacter zhuwentaonis]
MPFASSGEPVSVISQEIEAKWTGEGGIKGTTKGAATVHKVGVPRKLTFTTAVSADVVRTNLHQYMESLVDELGAAFAKAFDEAVLFGNTAFGADNHVSAISKQVQLGKNAQKDGGL